MSVQRQIDKLVAVRAAEWYEAIRAGETDTSSDEFRRWISESPRHVDAFMVVAGQAPLIRDVLKSTPMLLHEQLRRFTPSPVPIESASVGDNSEIAQPGQKRSRFSWAGSLAWGSLAASVAVLAVVLWGAPSRWQHFETGAGEQRAMTLADGSIVNLNAQSIVEVRLQGYERDLRLLRGDAIFKVAHDKLRPFNVSTATANVRAVGTEFAVALKDEGTTVTVMEGKVEVRPTGQPAAASPESTSNRALPVAVEAGQEARVNGTGTVRFEPHADVAASVSWLQRKLVFRHTLIEDMVPEVNRYNRGTQLHLEGVRTGVFRFSGTFDANDPLSLADLLSREPGLSVERRGRDIYIRESAEHPD
jgi:transmembrane sensor